MGTQLQQVHLLERNAQQEQVVGQGGPIRQLGRKRCVGLQRQAGAGPSPHGSACGAQGPPVALPFPELQLGVQRLASPPQAELTAGPRQQPAQLDRPLAGQPLNTRVRTRGVPSRATVASCSQRAWGARPSRSRALRSRGRQGGRGSGAVTSDGLRLGQGQRCLLRMQGLTTAARDQTVEGIDEGLGGSHHDVGVGGMA